MGNRTVVVLYNDQCSEWSKDPLLGQKISIGMNEAHLGMRARGSAADLGYGNVAECTHADNQTLAIVEGYHYIPIVRSFWYSRQNKEEMQHDLLRKWAERLGYGLVKIPTKETK